MQTPNPIPKLNTQRGFALLEVLIAVLVLSIGLLGIAALQASALRNNQSALERSQAVVQSYAMLDAMRANPIGARNGDYNLAKSCASAPPAAGDLIAKEKRSWIQSLGSALGNDAATCGTIACVAGVCIITVEWNDSRGFGGTTVADGTQRLITVGQI